MIRHLLNANVTVYRPGYVSDGRGGRVKTMTEHGTIRARVMVNPAPREAQVAGDWTNELTHIVHALYGADVEREDELDVGGPRRLRVQLVAADSSRTYTRIDCQELQGG